MRLKMIAGLSAVFLFLLMAFATHYKIRLEQLEQSTGVLELLAAGIPLLSLLLASCFHRTPAPRAGKHPARHPASRRRPESSARR